jgi:hypothetical protein
MEEGESVGVVDVHPASREVAIVNLPPGTTARVHHAHGVRDYSGLGPEQSTILTAVGDVELLGWGGPAVVYLEIRQIRNGRHRRDREAWQAAVRAIQGGGVAYVQYEQRDYYGKSRWAAIGFRVD